MSDLIDRQAAIDGLFSEMPGVTFAGVLRVLQNLPSAQPEIIRCKDCAKHEYCRTSIVWAIPPKDDWFCADAERREE